MTEAESKTTEELISELESAEHPLTSKDVQQTYQSQSRKESDAIPIAAIIAIAVIALGCILSCAAITIVFLYNAPW